MRSSFLPSASQPPVDVECQLPRDIKRQHAVHVESVLSLPGQIQRDAVAVEGRAAESVCCFWPHPAVTVSVSQPAAQAIFVTVEPQYVSAHLHCAVIHIEIIAKLLEAELM